MPMSYEILMTSWANVIIIKYIQTNDFLAAGQPELNHHRQSRYEIQFEFQFANFANHSVLCRIFVSIVSASCQHIFIQCIQELLT